MVSSGVSAASVSITSPGSVCMECLHITETTGEDQDPGGTNAAGEVRRGCAEKVRAELGPQE